MHQSVYLSPDSVAASPRKVLQLHFTCRLYGMLRDSHAPVLEMRISSSADQHVDVKLQVSDVYHLEIDSVLIRLNGRWKPTDLAKQRPLIALIAATLGRAVYKLVTKLFGKCHGCPRSFGLRTRMVVHGPAVVILPSSIVIYNFQAIADVLICRGPSVRCHNHQISEFTFSN